LLATQIWTSQSSAGQDTHLSIAALQVTGRSASTAVTCAVLGRFPAGSLFGEVGFFDGAPRTATVRAEVSANVLRVTRDAFEQLRLSDAALATKLALELGRTVASHFRERLARYNETAREP
jgi:CRP-like cAMP-binding protein